jgi:hypothetical protein
VIFGTPIDSSITYILLSFSIQSTSAPSEKRPLLSMLNANITCPNSERTLYFGENEWYFNLWVVRVWNHDYVEFTTVGFSSRKHFSTCWICWRSTGDARWKCHHADYDRDVCNTRKDMWFCDVVETPSNNSAAATQ